MTWTIIYLRLGLLSDTVTPVMTVTRYWCFIRLWVISLSLSVESETLSKKGRNGCMKSKKKRKVKEGLLVVFHLNLPIVVAINLQSNRLVMGGKIKATGNSKYNVRFVSLQTSAPKVSPRVWLFDNWTGKQRGPVWKVILLPYLKFWNLIGIF